MANGHKEIRIVNAGEPCEQKRDKFETITLFIN